MAQYNFKIDEELEVKVKKALVDSGHEGKAEFLADMVAIYSSHLVNREESMSEKIFAYAHINDKTKEGLEKLFTHLLSTIDYNFSMVSQEQQRIEKEKAEFEERVCEVDSQIDKLKLAFIEEKKLLEESYIEKVDLYKKERDSVKKLLDQERLELVKVKEELSSLVTIAGQTSSIIKENKELRTLLSSNEKEHKEELLNVETLLKEELTQLRISYIDEKKELTQNITELKNSLRLEEKKYFVANHSWERCKEELDNMKKVEVLLQEKLNGLSEDLTNLSSKYNQLIGKVEVFEAFGEKNK